MYNKNDKEKYEQLINESPIFSLDKEKEKIEKRLKEVEKMGLKTCIIPETNKKLLKEKFKLDIIGCKDIIDAMKFLKLK